MLERPSTNVPCARDVANLTLSLPMQTMPGKLQRTFECGFPYNSGRWSYRNFRQGYEAIAGSFVNGSGPITFRPSSHITHLSLAPSTDEGPTLDSDFTGKLRTTAKSDSRTHQTSGACC